MLSLILCPNLRKMNGSGRNAIAMKPSNDVPQPIPSALYMLLPASGKRAPRTERKTVLAAVADAA